ncbi:RAD51-associated protein 2 isoform X2 [Ascaphus truei]|uniref:RAD51-associated protein 2 isoform X2 n=1 Tax=Ascaphus truei TaxID=8439 RepID=UPI003F59EDB7
MNQTSNIKYMYSNVNMESPPKEEFRRVTIENNFDMQCMFGLKYQDNKEKLSCNLANYMYRRQLPSTEVNHIWHVQNKCIETSQSHQLQLGTYREIPAEASGAETTNEILSSMINNDLTHDEMHNASKTSFNVKMDLKKQYSDCKDLKCFQRFDQNIHFTSLSNLTEVSLENWSLSSLDLIGKNDHTPTYVGISYVKDGVPLANVNTVLEHRRFTNISEPQQINDTQLTQEGKGIKYSNKCTESSASAYLGFNNPHSYNTPKDCGINQSYCNYNEMRNSRNFKRKLPISMPESGEQRAKIPRNIYTFKHINKVQTNEDRTPSSNYCLSDFMKSKNKIPQTSMSEICQIVDESSLTKYFWKSSTEINIGSKNVILPTVRSPKVQQGFLGQFHNNTPHYEMRYFTGAAVSNQDSTLKDSTLVQSLLHDISGIFINTAIPPNDSALRYTVPCSGLQTEEYRITNCPNIRLCYRSNADINTILQFDLSLQHLITSSNILLSNMNCIPQNEPTQKQKLICSSTDEKNNLQDKSNISANVLTHFIKSNDLQKSELMLPYDMKTYRFYGNNNESFLSTEKAFSTLFNYARQPEEQHFVFNTLFLIVAASLHGATKNYFSFFPKNSLQTTCEIETDYASHNDSFINLGMEVEEMEEDNLSRSENINKSNKSACVRYNTAVQNQTLHLSSHCQKKGNREHFEKDTFRNTLGTRGLQLCPNHVPFIDTFGKISLAPILVESQNDNLLSTYHENISSILKNSATLDNAAVFTSISTVHQVQWANKKQLVNNENIFDTSSTDHKTDHIQVPIVTINVETELQRFSEGDVCGTFLCKQTLSDIQKGEQSSAQNNALVTADHLTEEMLHFDRKHKSNNTAGLLLSNESMDCSDHNVQENRNLLFSPKDMKTNNVCSDHSVRMAMKRESVHSKESDVGDTFACEKWEVQNISSNSILSDTTSLVMRISNSSTFNPKKDYIQENTRGSGFLSSIIPENNVTFEMKSQFDLVLEELSMFHAISETQEEHSCKTETVKGLNNMCDTFGDLSNDIIGDSQHIVTPVNDNTECKIISKKDQSVNDIKILPQGRGQEVPQEYQPMSSVEDESLYFPVKEEKTFSHGIGRVTPLKTCTGPLRIGLSKKARIKQLHPNVR